MSESYITANEMMKELNISSATFYRLLAEGMPYKSVGLRKKLYNKGEVEEFINRRSSDLTCKLTVGQEYSNNEIVEIFKCGLIGSMRRSHTKNALILISYNDGEEYPCWDYWKDNILYYTGQGTDGDQSFDYAYNKTLYESEKNGIAIYLFEAFTSKKYTYRGIAKLIDKPFMSKITDITGNIRQVCKFPLKLINDNYYLSEEFVIKEEVQKHSLANAYIQSGNDNTELKLSQPISEITVLAKHTSCNPIIEAYVKHRANGVCELCGNKAPFEYHGEPYLEIAHIISASEGGYDNVSNAVALCPNCSARLKMLNDDKDKKALQLKAEEGRN